MADLIGALRVALGLDTAAFETGTKRAKASLNSLEADFAKLGAALTRFAGLFGVALGGGALVQFTQQSLAAAAALGRVADQAGISSTQLQQLAFAFRDTTVNQEQLAQASATLARNLSELQTGTGGFLSFLRNSAPHLVEQFRNVTDVSQAWSLLADVLQGLPNAHDRVRVAQAALGEAGARVANIMGQLGSQGFRRAADEAIRLGQVMDEQTIRQARELELRFRELGTFLSTQFARAAVAAADALNLLSRPLETQLADARSRLALIQERLAAERQVGETEASRARLEQSRVALLERIAELERQIAERRATPTPDEANRLVSNALARANEQLQAYMDRLQGTPIIFDQAGLSAEGWAARVETATRLVTAATEDSGAVAARVAAMKLQLARQEQQAILQTATMAAQTITALFPKSKGAAIAAAVINTAVGITRALSEVPWPWNWVQAGLIAAQGAAQIAAIRSASPTGGSTAPSVSGGGAGAGGGGGEGQAPQRVIISQVDPAAIFTGEVFNRFIEELNSRAENGHLVVASKLIS